MQGKYLKQWVSEWVSEWSLKDGFLLVASILFPPRCFCLRARRRLCEPIMGDHDSPLLLLVLLVCSLCSAQCAWVKSAILFQSYTHFPRTDASKFIWSDENVMYVFSTLLPQLPRPLCSLTNLQHTGKSEWLFRWDLSVFWSISLRVSGTSVPFHWGNLSTLQITKALASISEFWEKRI